MSFLRRIAKSKSELMLDPHLIETLADRTFTAESFIKEFIMNSYEADAERVEITIYNNGEVVIEDSGKYAGMTEEDINAFLTIATRYKTKKRFTKHYKRPIAGEMGIGRLSFFKAFNVLEVETEKDGRRLRFSLSEPLFNEVARKGRVSVDIDEEPPTGKNGTKLRFMGLKDKEYQVTPEQVRRIIESQFRFLLIKTRGPFKIFVNGVEVKPRRLPSGARKIVIDRVVEGVDIKGFKAVDSKITGFIILLKEKEKDPAFRGMQLYIRGSPIGPRRSLGEFLGDKILDSVIPFDKVTGEIEAPFLRPSASRQWVDVNHISFIKFKEVMGEIAEEILEEIRQQRETKIKKLKNPSLDSARKCLEKALRYEPDLWRKGGLVSMGAYDPSDKKVTDATTPLTKLKRLLSFGSRKGAREKKKADEPRKPRTVRHVHVGSGNSRKIRKSRGNKTFTWKIETMTLEENAPTFVDLSTNTIYVNESHPLYRRRLKDKITLRNYILREVAREIAHAVHKDDKKKAVEAYGRLLNRIEETNRIVT